MILDPYPTYFSQKDNRNPYTRELEPVSQCSVAAATMVFSWLELEHSESIVYKLMIETANIRKNRFNSSKNICETLNLALSTNGCREIAKVIEITSPEDLFLTLEKYKCPLLSSTGTFLTNAGHFIVMVGMSKGHGIFHDPFGVFQNGKYGNNDNGECVVFSHEELLKIYNTHNGGRNVIVIEDLAA
ncbi:MAG: papain-like cysteine protease family protein [Spirochaetota bacterium]